jgi:tetratricopeptide (TPR) repeat protein
MSERPQQPKRVEASDATHPQGAAPGGWRYDWRAGALVGTLALAIRCVHLADYSRLPLFQRPTVDAALYVDFARRFAESGALPDVFFKPPLFQVLLGAWWNVVGESWFWLRMPLVLLGAGTAVLAWLIARRLFTAEVALLAGLLYALHSSAVYFEAELLEMGLVTFVQVAAFWLVVRTERSHARPLALLCGGSLGLGIVARPTFLLFSLLALLILGRRRFSWIALGMIAAVAPVTLHNATRGGDLVFVSSNLGLNFYIGNNPNANGRIVSTPELPAEPAGARREARRIAEVQAGHALQASDVSRYWLKRGVEYAATQPARTVELALRKMFFLWSGTPLSDNEDMLSLRRYLRVYALLPVGMWLLAPLGLVGLMFSRAANRAAVPPLWLARGYVACQVLAVWPFFVVERFRLPWAPLLAVFTAWTLIELATRLRRAPRSMMRLTAAAMATLALCNVPAFGVRDAPVVDLDYKVAYAYHQLGRVDEAMRAYRNAIERNPRAALARNALGYLLAERREKLDEAAQLVREALELDATRTANYAESLAFVELQRDNPDAALAACDLGLASSPGVRTRTLLLLRRAEANRSLGKPAAALADAQAALDLAPSEDLRTEARGLSEALSPADGPPLPAATRVRERSPAERD